MPAGARMRAAIFRKEYPSERKAVTWPTSKGVRSDMMGSLGPPRKKGVPPDEAVTTKKKSSKVSLSKWLRMACLY